MLETQHEPGLEGVNARTALRSARMKALRLTGADTIDGLYYHAARVQLLLTCILSEYKLGSQSAAAVKKAIRLVKRIHDTSEIQKAHKLGAECRTAIGSAIRQLPRSRRD